jgi:hypothetical protein
MGIKLTVGRILFLDAESRHGFLPPSAGELLSQEIQG